MSAKINILVLKKKLTSMYGDIITVDESTYNGIGNKCRFVDRDYGEWWARPTDVLQGEKKS